MIRWGILDSLVAHFFIGLGVGAYYLVHVAQRGKPRRLFRFRDGSLPHWLRWYGAALLFEFVTSFLMGEHLYLELGLSIFEAGMLTLGLFVMDRVAEWLTRAEAASDDEPPFRFPSWRSRRERAPRPTRPTPPTPADERADRLHRFDENVRGR